MNHPDPHTEAEALQLGLKRSTKDAWEEYLKQLHGTNNTIEETMALRRVPIVDCHKVPSGTKCLEGPCIDGYKGVSFCSVDHECTFYDPEHPGYLVPC
ncbi:MAG: hypothetical protein P4N59_30965 [Negativicutes bacterium]|nr:hypothetical protein [Negativicutes bacterium]